MQTLPLASQETCAAVEFYHNQLKLRLLNEREPCVYHRTDWLVDKLGKKVHAYFWLDEYSGKDGFARYWKEEWVSGLTSWRKALKISDSDVSVDGKCAKVIDQLDRDRVYVVWNPGSQFGMCNCNWSEMGNMCEHMLKVISICRKKKHAIPSISLLQYHQALTNILNCPPHDSLMRDHAVSLAVFVQKQIDMLVDLESSNTIGVQAVLSNEHQLSVNENHTNEDASHNEDGSGDESDTSARVMGDADGEVDDIVSGNGIIGASAEAEIACDEMDVDPSSICISPPQLYSVDEVVSNGVFSENRERVMVDTESEHFSSTSDSFINPTCCEEDFFNKGSQESMMDVEPLSVDVPPSTIEFVEQCTVAHQNDVHTVDLIQDANALYNKTAPSTSIPVEPGGVEVADTAVFIKEN